MKRRALFLVLVLCLAAGCRLNVIQHDIPTARKTAETFGNQAFVERDLRTAAKLLIEDLSPEFDDAAFAKLVNDMHADGKFPSAVKAIEYDTPPGLRIVDVYLEGAIDNRKVYYLLNLSGDSGNGYRVAAMYRRDAPFPVMNNIERKPF